MWQPQMFKSKPEDGWQNKGPNVSNDRKDVPYWGKNICFCCHDIFGTLTKKKKTHLVLVYRSFDGLSKELPRVLLLSLLLE